jgi:hypothetical protein
MVRLSKEYFNRDLLLVVKDALGVRKSLREARAQKTDEEFARYLRGIQLDPGAAADWLSWDGALESVTDRMIPYLVPPLTKTASA